MIGGHAKVKVFLPEHDDYLDVFVDSGPFRALLLTFLGSQSGFHD